MQKDMAPLLAHLSFTLILLNSWQPGNIKEPMAAIKVLPEVEGKQRSSPEEKSQSSIWVSWELCSGFFFSFWSAKPVPLKWALCDFLCQSFAPLHELHDTGTSFPLGSSINYTEKLQVIKYLNYRSSHTFQFSKIPVQQAGFPAKKKPKAVPSLFPDATPSTSSFKAPFLSRCLWILPFLLCIMLFFINDTKQCQKWQNYTQDINIMAINVPRNHIKLANKGLIVSMTAHLAVVLNNWECWQKVSFSLHIQFI